MLRELGRNSIGGRTAYLALQTRTQRPVVIKQFQFAQFNSDWSGFQACEREIQVLKGLNHPGIPRYLDSFETADGFCLVQEYKNARPLSEPRSFEPEEVKKIALSLLEILVYLQNRTPPVIHRDIKPENVLVDESLRVYLVDFGFARIGAGEVALSSVALGTVGFMPPEQIYNRQLTEASDLYSIGMTLICLLTQTKSTAADTLISEDNTVNFKLLVPHLSRRWVEWLEKLVQPNPKNRYSHAQSALEALKPLEVRRQPEVSLSLTNLQFQATETREKLSQVITVVNAAPGTLLEGAWEVAPHASDPPHTPDRHAWISVQPDTFSQNAVQCEVTVDLSKLMRGKTYVRSLVLHTNSEPERQILTLEVQTAKVNKVATNPPYLYLIILGGCSGILLSMMGVLVRQISLSEIQDVFLFSLIGALAGAVIGGALKKGKIIEWQNIFMGSIRGLLIGGGSLLGYQVSRLIFQGYDRSLTELMWILLGAMVPVLMLNLLDSTTSKMLKEGFNGKFIFSSIMMALTWGVSLMPLWLPRTPISLSFLSPPATFMATVAFLGILLYPKLRQAKLTAKTRKAEQYLIKP